MGLVKGKQLSQGLPAGCKQLSFDNLTTCTGALDSGPAAVAAGLT